MKYQDQVLSCGTAFCLRDSDNLFLLTNRHNVTGRHQETGSPLSKTCAVPDMATFTYRCAADPNRVIEYDQPLYDASGGANWIEHPFLQQEADIACFRVDIPEPHRPLILNEAANHSMQIYTGTDVFVVGFPIGYGTFDLPIWKRASVATPPNIDVDNKPIMLVDTASRPGMSGSPVLAYARGTYYDGNSVIVLNGYAASIVGMHSGRILHANDLDSQLGIVWKEKALLETIKKGIQSSHQFS